MRKQLDLNDQVSRLPAVGPGSALAAKTQLHAVADMLRQVGGDGLLCLDLPHPAAGRTKATAAPARTSARRTKHGGLNGNPFVASMERVLKRQGQFCFYILAFSRAAAERTRAPEP